MAYDNNKTEIIKNWKNKFQKTKSPYYARCVYEATGELPDHEAANNLGGYEKSEVSEDELILEAIKNNQHIF